MRQDRNGSSRREGVRQWRRITNLPGRMIALSAAIGPRPTLYPRQFFLIDVCSIASISPLRRASSAAVLRSPLTMKAAGQKTITATVVATARGFLPTSMAASPTNYTTAVSAPRPTSRAPPLSAPQQTPQSCPPPKERSHELMLAVKWAQVEQTRGDLVMVIRGSCRRKSR